MTDREKAQLWDREVAEREFQEQLKWAPLARPAVLRRNDHLSGLALSLSAQAQAMGQMGNQSQPTPWGQYPISNYNGWGVGLGSGLGSLAGLIFHPLSGDGSRPSV